MVDRSHNISERVPTSQQENAARFKQLHAAGIFVMPCAWDAGSARAIEEAGFACLGTTSGGVNWAKARQDYVYEAPLADMLRAYGDIAAAVALPVSGDLENGYGREPEVVAATVTAAVEAGMVGGSIEDQTSEATPGLFDRVLAAERIAAARSAVDDVLPNFVLTARAESFWGGVDDPMEDALERCRLYADAGADCVFVPGLADLDALAILVESVGVPVSLGIGSGGGTLDLASLADVGVRRVSTGGAIPRAMYSALAVICREMLDAGTFGFTKNVVSGQAINSLMAN